METLINSITQGKICEHVSTLLAHLDANLGLDAQGTKVSLCVELHIFD